MNTEEQQTTQYLSAYLEEGESLVHVARGRKGEQYLLIVGLLIGVFSRIFGLSVYVGLTNKRLIVAIDNNQLLKSYDLSTVSVNYHTGLSWLSHFYPSWITIQEADGTKLYVLAYGSWRDNFKAMVGKK